jgi:Fic family protein
LMQSEAIRQELSGLVIQPELLVSLRETATLMSTHFSTQIEGNRLTLPEVKAVITGAKFPGRERDESEVRNHLLAFAYMEQLALQQSALQESEIKRLHGLGTLSIRNHPSLS